MAIFYKIGQQFSNFWSLYISNIFEYWMEKLMAIAKRITFQGLLQTTMQFHLALYYKHNHWKKQDEFKWTQEFFNTSIAGDYE